MFQKMVIPTSSTDKGSPIILIGESSSTGSSVTVSNNTRNTLYAYLKTASSNATYRTDNSKIASVTGCDTPIELQYYENTSSSSIIATRLYRLDSCQSTVTVTKNSTTSSTQKDIVIFAIE